MLKKIRAVFPTRRQGDLKLFFLCLAATTIFWFFNALNKQDYTAKINYPVTFEFNKDSLVALEELPSSIQLSVNGGGWNLLKKNLLNDASPLEISLTGTTGTSYILTANLESRIRDKIENQFTLNGILTDTIKLAIDRLVSRPVRVYLDKKSIQVDDNYRISSPVYVNPSEVLIQGPAAVLDTMPSTYVIKLDEQDINEDFEKKVALSLEEQELLSATPEVVNVSFTVDRIINVVQEVSISKVNFPENSNIKLRAREAMLELETIPRYNDLVENQPIIVFADYDALNASDSTITLKISNRPPYVSSVKITPTKVKVYNE